MCRLVTVVLFVGLTAVGCVYGQAAEPDTPISQVRADDSNEVDLAIRSLQDKAAELKTYQADVNYVTRQPLLESRATRTGTLHYGKLDGRSSLRISFLTLQQDEEPKQRYVEQFMFDGVWLVIVNHQTKRVERRQMTEPNRPMDAFALASKHMPVLGFSKMDDLRKQFDVAIVPEPNEQAAFQHLCLTVRPDSVYKDDYTKIDFWIDRKLGLPARITAVTTEEDVHEIELKNPKVNEGIDPKIFQMDVPKGFAEEVIPLEKQTQQK